MSNRFNTGQLNAVLLHVPAAAGGAAMFQRSCWLPVAVPCKVLGDNPVSG